MSSNTNQIKGGALLSYLSIILGNVIVLIYTPFMLRSLGSSEYGIYSICNTVSSAIAMLDSGFGIAVVRFIVRSKNDEAKLPSILGTLCIINFILGILAMCIMGGIALNTESIFGGSMNAHELFSVKTILWITGAYLSLTFISSIFPAIVVAHERFIFIKIVDIAKSIMLPLLIVPFLLAGYKAIAMSLVTVIVFLLMNVAKLVYCYLKLNTHISFKNIDKTLIKEVLPFAAIVIFKLLLDRVYWSGGQLILGIVSGTTAVAIIALALQLSGYYNAIALSINNMFLPRCTELTEKKDISGISTLFIRVSRIQTYILGIFICVFLVFGKLFIKLWAGEEYAETFWCCLIIMVPYTIPLTQGIANSILQAQNKLKFQSIVYTCIVVAVIIFSVLFGKLYGALGCAIVISACIIFGETLIMNIYYKKIGLNISLFWKNFLHIVAPLSVIGLLFFFVNRYTLIQSWWYFLIGVSTMTFCLMIVSYFLMGHEDKTVVNVYINKIVHKR